MAKAAVDISVGGRSYRVVSDAPAQDLQRLAHEVDERLRKIARHPDAMMLVALELAHDLLEAREERRRSAERSQRMLGALLTRVDDALDHVDENGDPLRPVTMG
jgi:cell division protein ZapA